MTGVMWLLHRMKWANADMVRAIGSIYTRSYELSLIPGLIIHYTVGLFFAFLYALLVGFAPLSTPGAVFILANAVGLVHGLTIGLLLEIVVAEHHPLQRFRRAGFQVVVAHIVGHLAYALTVGSVFALAWNKIQDSVKGMVHGGAIGEFIGFSLIWLPLFGIPFLFVGYIVYWALTTEVRAEAKALEREQRETFQAKQLAIKTKRTVKARSKLKAV